MDKRCQYTVSGEITARGVGLHTGCPVSMTIKPAAPGTGIVFVRKDAAPRLAIPADHRHVVSTDHATVLGIHDGARRVEVSTVEHLMAAFAGLGVDNAVVELDGPEVPAMDGSAAPFVRLLETVGLESQGKPRRLVRVLEPIAVSLGIGSILLEPSSRLELDVEIDFSHPQVARQRFRAKVDYGRFVKKIAKARTFGFLKEVEWLRRNGLALGGSLENAVVIGDSGVLNEEGLRFSDEFVRHKALDLIGDLYLFGAPILAKITAVRTGHALHAAALRALAERPWAWEYVEHTARFTVPSLPCQRPRVAAPQVVPA